MNVLVWVVEGTWPATVDAARGLAGDVTLLHVIDPAVAASAGQAYAGLLGRHGWPHRRHPDPGAAVEAAAVEAERDLLAAAQERLGRPAQTAGRSGRIEREVVAACAGFDLLVAARDGDLSRVGPHSLGPATRFVVDHAPCAVLLVWPQEPAQVEPPPPPHHPPHHPPPHPPARH
jgi:nucleotide-binding universal stress UspA family protein